MPACAPSSELFPLPAHMSSAERFENSWSEEIWIQVFFCLLGPDTDAPCDDARCCDLTVHSLQADISSYARFKLQLRLVCKRFKQILGQHPPLLEAFAVSKDISPRKVPSMIQYLQQNGRDIRFFTASCQYPAADFAAVAMLSPKPKLTKATLLHVSDNMTAILSAFDSLVMCDLRTTAGSSVNLAPLGALPRLTTLVLCDGPFSDIHVLQHLTALTLWQVTLISQDWTSISKLQRLTLSYSAWSGLEFGLTVCTALTSLKCLNSVVTAADAAHIMKLRDDNVYNLQTPINFSTMNQIHDLSLQCTGTIRGADNGFIFAMYNLVNLHMNFGSVSRGSLIDLSAHMDIDNRLTRLSKLEKLSLHLNGSSTLRLMVDWGCMSTLRQVQFHASRISMSEGILGISHLKHLRSLTFDCDTMGRRSSLLMCDLLHDLTVRRPHVECRIHGGFVTKIRWQFGNVRFGVPRMASHTGMYNWGG